MLNFTTSSCPTPAVASSCIESDAHQCTIQPLCCLKMGFFLYILEGFRSVEGFIYFSLGQLKFKLTVFYFLERKDTLKKWWPKKGKKMKISFKKWTSVIYIKGWKWFTSLNSTSFIFICTKHLRNQRKSKHRSMPRPGSWISVGLGCSKLPTTKYPPGLRAMFCMAPSNSECEKNAIVLRQMAAQKINLGISSNLIYYPSIEDSSWYIIMSAQYCFLWAKKTLEIHRIWASAKLHVAPIASQ